MTNQNAKKEAVRVTLVGMWLDLVLGALKAVGGTMTGSFALVADGIHSLTDAVTDIFVLIVSHYSNEGPDAEHPYGHGRFEAIGTVVMGMVFFAIAAVLIYDSVLRLRDSENIVVPAIGGLVIAAISIAAKEWIYHYTMRTANKLNSSLLRANAWHSRSDAISSIAVLIGLIGAQQGLPWLDVIAAIFVALIIARIGWELCLDSLRELVDTAIPGQHQKEITNTILEVTGVNQVTSLRSRQSGGKILLEVQIQVDPRISVSEGHQLGEAVSAAVSDRFSNISDVVVHIDTEFHDSHENLHLPLREDIVLQIKQVWEQYLPDEAIRNVDLHYIDAGVEVDLYLRADEVDETLAQQLKQALQLVESVSRLNIYCSILEADINDIPGHR
jgi:cation diffusion facilitator family transporter